MHRCGSIRRIIEIHSVRCQMGAFSDVATTTVFHLSEIEKADAELFLVPASNK